MIENHIYGVLSRGPMEGGIGLPVLHGVIEDGVPGLYTEQQGVGKKTWNTVRDVGCMPNNGNLPAEKKPQQQQPDSNDKTA